MFSFQFVAADYYRERIVQMGELPELVFNSGPPGLDEIQGLNFLNRKALEQEIDFSLAKLNFIVSYHHFTLQEQFPNYVVWNMLAALDEFKRTLAYY
jgi:hypothetical protein